MPFDLRHLRVIIYDVREPTWAEKLRKNIADYLRNAKAEPEKSIPQPFRRQEEEENAEPTAEADRGRHPGFPSFNVLAGGPGSLAVPLALWVFRRVGGWHAAIHEEKKGTRLDLNRS